jgi:hypothetical protein
VSTRARIFQVNPLGVFADFCRSADFADLPISADCRFCRSPDFADSPILPTKFDGSADRIPADRKICRRRSDFSDFADPKLPPCLMKNVNRQ